MSKKHRHGDLYKQELQNNPTGNVRDHLQHAQSSVPNTSDMSAKEIGVLIVVAVILFILYRVLTS